MNDHPNLLLKLTVISYCLLLCTGLVAKEKKAASLLDTDVQAAIDSASDGDIICLPEGAASWTKGVTMNERCLEIRGAGIGKTIIHNEARCD